MDDWGRYTKMGEEGYYVETDERELVTPEESFSSEEESSVDDDDKALKTTPCRWATYRWKMVLWKPSVPPVTPNLTLSPLVAVGAASGGPFERILEILFDVYDWWSLLFLSKSTKDFVLEFARRAVRTLFSRYFSGCNPALLTSEGKQHPLKLLVACCKPPTRWPSS